MRELFLEQIDLTDRSFISLSETIRRIDQLDQFRIKRALNNSNDAFQRVFTFVPLLLHYNHPSLASYTENAPCGIYQFEPNETQSAYLADIQLYSIEHFDFDGLYAMGSLGSITQTTLSDLDFWLCYSKQFSEDERYYLEKKLHKIELWAKEQGVDVNFYLMNPEEFRSHKYDSEVTAEHCGSAQHYFLLDEFYRSAIRLGGKRVLWLHLSDECEDYQTVVTNAVSNNLICLDEWLDFGDFSELPLGEYFGASLWQLYKGIDYPYKSAIKILLLESYSETYPETFLISKKFKALLHSNKALNYHFDPYIAMLEQVTDYLTKRQEFTRLECLRYCFYIKSSEGQLDSWKKQELNALATTWGWSETEFHLLEMKSHWKVKQAMRHQQMLVEQFLQSYRHLINFARKFQIDPSIMPQDTDLLMRKLYSVFEVLPGKITLINEKIASNLSENEVTFVEVTEHCSAKTGWYMINHAPLSAYDSTKRYVQYHKSLNKLVAWAYFNGIVTVNTQLHLVSQTISLTKLRQFIADLRLSFPAKSPIVKESDLYHPNEIRNLIVAVNLTKDPTREMSNRPDLSQLSLFNLGSSEEGIIGSISIIYRNMWNEIITQHIEGHDSILKALKLISNKIYRSSAPPQSVNVFCYSVQLRNELQKFVMGLVNRCITVQTGGISSKQADTFNLAGKKWQLVFGKQIELKELITENEQSLTVEAPKAFTVPKEIYSFASEGFLQFFFEDLPTGEFNVYVLDKKNKVEIYPECIGEKEAKIRQISRLYAEDESLQNSHCLESFNYPQFYQLLEQAEGLIIVPFQSKQHRDYLEKLKFTKN